jgi:hypothetical protein
MEQTLPPPPHFEPEHCKVLLREWIARQSSADSLAWLDDRAQAVAQGDKKALFLAFGLVPRKLGKDDLRLSADDLRQAAAVRPRWSPGHWSVDQAARTVLALSLPAKDPEPYVETLDKVFAAGEVGELVALYQALPVMPHQETHVLRAAEGVRTNIQAVFRAVAHKNPYPAERLEENRWNQMVLKSLFIGVPLYPIVGLDGRGNATLMRMLIDYAHERWAAGRPVSPELWRCVGPHADEKAVRDMKRVLECGGPTEREAAALALAACPRRDAAEDLHFAPDFDRRARQGELNWEDIGRAAAGG